MNLNQLAVMSIETVLKITSLSKATIYRLIAEGKFPQAIQLSPGRKAWRECEIKNWLEDPMNFKAKINE